MLDKWVQVPPSPPPQTECAILLSMNKQETAQILRDAITEGCTNKEVEHTMRRESAVPTLITKWLDQHWAGADNLAAKCRLLDHMTLVLGEHYDSAENLANTPYGQLASTTDEDIRTGNEDMMERVLPRLTYLSAKAFVDKLEKEKEIQNMLAVINAAHRTHPGQQGLPL